VAGVAGCGPRKGIAGIPLGAEKVASGEGELIYKATEGGEVFVHGERWQAISPGPIPRGAQVVVRRVEGLTLHVDEVKT
jgi:membrane-bound ClpP family serine protease